MCTHMATIWLQLSFFDVQIVDVDVDECQHIISQYPSGNLDLPCSSTDMMYLIYTSGSTGNPKGVMVDHLCLVNLIDWSIDNWELSSQSSVLLKTALSFDPSVFEIFAPLALGGRLVIASPGGHEDCNYMTDLISRERYADVASASFDASRMDTLASCNTHIAFAHVRTGTSTLCKFACQHMSGRLLASQASAWQACLQLWQLHTKHISGMCWGNSC